MLSYRRSRIVLTSLSPTSPRSLFLTIIDNRMTVDSKNASNPRFIATTDHSRRQTAPSVIDTCRRQNATLQLRSPRTRQIPVKSARGCAEAAKYSSRDTPLVIFSPPLCSAPMSRPPHRPEPSHHYHRHNTDDRRNTDDSRSNTSQSNVVVEEHWAMKSMERLREDG